MSKHIKLYIFTPIPQHFKNFQLNTIKIQNGDIYNYIPFLTNKLLN